MDSVNQAEQDSLTNTLTAPTEQSSPVSFAAKHDPYAALRFRDFRLLVIGRFVSALGEQMLSVAIGWELYERTHNTLALGLVGLVQVLPIILLSLPAGHTADRFNRKQIVLVTQTLLAIFSLGLALLSHAQGSLVLVYGCLLGIGIGRSFNGPATSSLLPQTIPAEVFTSAATWSSSAWQFASILGPALGGLVIAVQQSATLVYGFDAVASVISFALIAMIRSQQVSYAKEPRTLKSLVAGITFIRHTKIILAAITLDMFAVLFGGAMALLPAYAKDILQVGPTGLGWLRAAPSIGALMMVLITAHRPPFRQAGRTLLWAVAGFGVATIIFGVSQSFILSLLMLATLGALDNISVVIRSTLLLVNTPDTMRGRVAAVNSVFIGTSNELGAFESGLVASIFGGAAAGTIASVVSGGIGTLIVVIAVAAIWPELRRLKRLDEAQTKSTLIPPSK